MWGQHHGLSSWPVGSNTWHGPTQVHLAHACGTKVQPGLTQVSCQFRVTWPPCVLAKPGEKRQFVKKAPVPHAQPVLGTAKLEKTQRLGHGWKVRSRQKAKERTQSEAALQLGSHSFVTLVPDLYPRSKDEISWGTLQRHVAGSPLGTL